jgi:hypothetical protein
VTGRSKAYGDFRQIWSAGFLHLTGSHDDPALWAAIVRQRRRVFYQLEPKHVNEEVNRGVVVLHDKGDEFKMRHRGSDYS